MPNHHETASYQQIADQYRAHHNEPTVLITRGNGEIQTASLTGDTDDEGRRLVSFSEDGKTKLKPIANMNLTDERQDELAKQLAASRESLDNPSRKLIAVVKSAGREAVDDVLRAGDHESDARRVELRQEDIDRAVGELDGSLSAKFAAAFRGIPPTAEARRSALDPNSGDSTVRNEAERLIRETIDDIGGTGKLPERVQRNDLNDQKAVADQRFGYDQPKYSPRDYASKLALAILDGSFRGDPHKLDYNDLPADDPRNGQHRQAALMALARLIKRVDDSRENPEKSDDVMAQIQDIFEKSIDGADLSGVERMTRGEPISLPEISRLEEGTYQLLSRLARIDVHDQEEQRQVEEIIENMRLPARMLANVVDDIRRWQRYREDQGDTAGVKRLREEIDYDLARAVRLLRTEIK